MDRVQDAYHGQATSRPRPDNGRCREEDGGDTSNKFSPIHH